jgi:hypothetical protein
MKQSNDNKTIDLPFGDEPKRGRGRPTKPDALTPAERAKRYRDAKRGNSSSFRVGESCSRCIELQKKLDLEHLALVDALNKIARLEDALAKPAANPLASEVRKLKRELKKRDEEYAKNITVIREEHAASKKR